MPFHTPLQLVLLNERVRLPWITLEPRVYESGLTGETYTVPAHNFADELREMRREGREDRKQIHERIRELEVSLDHKLDAWGHQLAQDIRVSRNANGSRVPPWIYLLVGGALMLGGEGLKMIWTLLEQALG